MLHRLPVSGTEALHITHPFVAYSVKDQQRMLGMLPQSHTCENALELPDYWEALLTVQQGLKNTLEVAHVTPTTEQKQQLMIRCKQVLEDRLTVSGCLRPASSSSDAVSIAAAWDVLIRLSCLACCTTVDMPGTGRAPPHELAAATLQSVTAKLTVHNDHWVVGMAFIIPHAADKQAGQGSCRCLQMAITDCAGFGLDEVQPASHAHHDMASSTTAYKGTTATAGASTTTSSSVECTAAGNVMLLPAAASGRAKVLQPLPSNTGFTPIMQIGSGSVGGKAIPASAAEATTSNTIRTPSVSQVTVKQLQRHHLSALPSSSSSHHPVQQQVMSIYITPDEEEWLMDSIDGSKYSAANSAEQPGKGSASGSARKPADSLYATTSNIAIIDSEMLLSASRHGSKHMYGSATMSSTQEQGSDIDALMEALHLPGSSVV